MEFKYDDIARFIEYYFKTFSKYGHNPEYHYKMNDFYAPELEFVPYIQGDKNLTNREQFYQLNMQPTLEEHVVPKQMIIDDRRGWRTSWSRRKL